MTKSSPAKLAYQKTYNAKPANVDKRVMNNQARAEAIKGGRAKVGDGKDVAHRRALDNGGTNTKGNTMAQDRATNRGWRKGESGYKVPNTA